MKLAITLVLSAVIAASSVGCVLESVQLGHEGAGADVGKDGDVCPGGGQTCASDSVASASCGDGIVQAAAGESCDDGGKLNGDGCSATCQLEVRTKSVPLAGGLSHTCALVPDGRVKCWGDNEWGQLGLGDKDSRGDEPNEMGDDLPVVDLGQGITAVAIAAGLSHTCALLSDGHVKCWGDNQYGQLGLGDNLDRGDEPNEMGDNLPAVDLGTGAAAAAISTSGYHTCALLSDGRVKCWGYNALGQLGLGDTHTRGDLPNSMGDNLREVDLGTGASAAAIAVGVHTCALLVDGRVKCWGYNEWGQLGLGDTSERGDAPNEMGDNLPAVDLGAGAIVVALSAHNLHTCALLSDGRVKCWGDNHWAQLGLGDILARGDEPNEMGDGLRAVDLGTGRTAVEIAACGIHTCALLSDGHVKCWGDNLIGDLGLGDSLSHGGEPNEMGDTLPFVDLGTGTTAVSIYAGGAYACALLSDGRVKCWGSNSWAQLGLGDTRTRGDAPNEMGDNLPAVDL